MDWSCDTAEGVSDMAALRARSLGRGLGVVLLVEGDVEVALFSTDLDF